MQIAIMQSETNTKGGGPFGILVVGPCSADFTVILVMTGCIHHELLM